VTSLRIQQQFWLSMRILILADSDCDQEDESPLYEDRPNFLQVRKSLDEEKRQKLREVLDEFPPSLPKFQASVIYMNIKLIQRQHHLFVLPCVL